MRLVEVNAGPGALALDEKGRLIAVWALEIVGGKIQSIRSIVNPDKLAHLGPTGDFKALLTYDFQQTGPGGRGPSRQ
jgi:RNA polymerase sigma-70 factor (ECF subfamily)